MRLIEFDIVWSGTFLAVACSIAMATPLASGVGTPLTWLCTQALNQGPYSKPYDSKLWCQHVSTHCFGCGSFLLHYTHWRRSWCTMKYYEWSPQQVESLQRLVVGLWPQQQPLQLKYTQIFGSVFAISCNFQRFNPKHWRQDSSYSKIKNVSNMISHVSILAMTRRKHVRKSGNLHEFLGKCSLTVFCQIHNVTSKAPHTGRGVGARCGAHKNSHHRWRTLLGFQFDGLVDLLKRSACYNTTTVAGFGSLHQLLVCWIHTVKWGQ